MQIPSLLYGTYREARKRCRQALERHWCGQPWLDAFEAGGMIETATHPGLLVLGGSPTWLAEGPHFHCSLPLITAREYWTTLDDAAAPAADAIFAAALERPWGVLGMFSEQDMYRWLLARESERSAHFLRAVLVDWDLLAAEGRRYSWGFEGKPLWHRPSTLKFVLARQGVPGELLRQPLPPGGLRALLHVACQQAGPALSPLLQELVRTMDDLPSLPAPTTPPNEALFVEPSGSGPDLNFMSDEMSAAMDRNDPATVQRLIEEGEAVDALDLEKERTPLYWAIRQGHTALVQVLLEHGASTEERYSEGESPLMEAALHGHEDIVRLLLERGADPTYRPEKGWDAVDFAEMGQHEDLAARLTEAQALYVSARLNEALARRDASSEG